MAPSSETTYDTQSPLMQLHIGWSDRSLVLFVTLQVTNTRPPHLWKHIKSATSRFLLRPILNWLNFSIWQTQMGIWGPENETGSRITNSRSLVRASKAIRIISLWEAGRKALGWSQCCFNQVIKTNNWMIDTCRKIHEVGLKGLKILD